MVAQTQTTNKQFQDPKQQQQTAQAAPGIRQHNTRAGAMDDTGAINKAGQGVSETSKLFSPKRSAFRAACGVASGRMEKLHASLTEIVKTFDREFRVEVVPFAKGDYGLACGVLAIKAMNSKLGTDPGSFYTVCVVDGTEMLAENIVYGFGGQVHKVSQLPGAMNDTQLQVTVGGILAEGGVVPSYAGGMVVQQNVDMTKQQSVQEIINTIFTALGNDMEIRTPTYKPLNLCDRKHHDAVLLLTQQRVSGTVTTAEGIHHSAKISATVASVPKNAANVAVGQIQSAHSSGQGEMIGSYSGWLYPFLDQAALAQHCAIAATGQLALLQGAPKPFSPCLVIDSTKLYGLDDLATTLLLIGCARSSVEGNAWHNAFSVHAGESPDVQDIGDVGHLNVLTQTYRSADKPSQTGFGEKVDLQSSVQTPMLSMMGTSPLTTFLSQIFSPSGMLAIDVYDGAADSFRTGILASAAAGDQQADSIIRTTLDHLTNGGYSRKYPVGGFFLSGGERAVYYGSFTSASGAELSLDVLLNPVGLLAVGGGNQKTYEDIYQTNAAIFSVEYPALARREVLHRVINTYTGGSAKIIGIKYRCIVANDALAAMMSSLIESGLMLQTKAVENTGMMMSNVGAMFQGAMMSPVSGYFQQAGQYGNGQLLGHTAFRPNVGAVNYTPAFQTSVM